MIDEGKFLRHIGFEYKWNEDIIKENKKNEKIIFGCQVENNLYDKLKFMIKRGKFNTS